LSHLLDYLSSKYMEGGTGEVKEYEIGVEVLGRPPSFDPTEDAAARVEAHRLRKRLREYYESEGHSHTLRIEVPLGRYAITFQRIEIQAPTGEKHEAVESGVVTPPTAVVEEPLSSPSPKKWHPGYGVALSSLAFVLLAMGFIAFRAGSATKLPAPPPPKSPIPAPTGVTNGDAAKVEPTSALPPLPQSTVRIGCGRTKSYTDRWGATWDGDRYFEGGEPFETSRRFIARADDPKLFQFGRKGNFTYKIPLSGGPYELHLFFMEDTYGPGMPAGGGEISRIFEVQANKPFKLPAQFWDLNE
jgi:hypothetical protein